MFGFGKPDPLAQLAAINTRVNTAHTPLSPLDKTTQDPDGVYDCDNYAGDKYMAQDWPQGVTGTRMNVQLPNGEMHRVLVAHVGNDQWILDNLTNELMLRQERERQGWKFSDMPTERVQEPAAQLQAQYANKGAAIGN